jgi:hypothetical protein
MQLLHKPRLSARSNNPVKFFQAFPEFSISFELYIIPFFSPESKEI